MQEIYSSISYFPGFLIEVRSSSVISVVK